MVGRLILNLTFYPVYLVEVRHHSPVEMSTLMSVMGIGSLVAALLVPHLSGLFGRRRIMITFAFIGALSPLGVRPTRRKRALLRSAAAITTTTRTVAAPISSGAGIKSTSRG